MKILFVGDAHVTADELEDSQRLIDYVISVANQTGPDEICFLGDQHHNHSLLRVEVLHFWRDAIAKLPGSITMLVGNHDRPHDRNYPNHGLVAYSSRTCRVIDCKMATLSPDSVVYVPWMPNDEFVESMREMSGNLLVCHQTFNGAKYDNGMYAPDGVDVSVVANFKKVISGHIHKPQSFANIEYVGSPRWRTLSDANQKRHLMLYNSETGNTQYFPMEGTCEAIYVHDDVEGVDQAPLRLMQPYRLFVNVRGSQEYIDRRLLHWTKNANVATFPTRTAKYEVRESMGVNAALAKHLEHFVPPNGTDLTLLHKMIAERIHV